VTRRRTHFTRGFSWTLATVAGLCGGGSILVLANALGLDLVLLGLPIMSASWTFRTVSLEGLLLSGAVIGVVTGLMQWALLRHWFQIAGWWVLVTAGCLATGSIAFFFAESVVERAFVPVDAGLVIFGPLFPPPFIPAIAVVGPGAIVGVGQWLVLRRQVRRFGWWIGANVIAWPAGTFLTSFVNDLLQAWTWSPERGIDTSAWTSIPYFFLHSNLSIWDLSGLLALGFVVGTLTGLVLVFAKRNSSMTASKERLLE